MARIKYFNRATGQWEYADSQFAVGGGSGALSTAQIEALDGMFKVCAYDESKDYVSAYAAFKSAFGLSGSGGGGEEPEAPTTYSILNTLTNVTTSNTAVSTSGGNAYYAKLTPDDGYSIDSVVVTMGGVDISATAVNGAEISISSVTGDIVIIATAVQNQAQTVEMSKWYSYGGATLYSDDGTTAIEKSDYKTKACSVNPFEVDTIISFKYVNGDTVLYMPPIFACVETPVTGNTQTPIGYYAEVPTHTECGSNNSSQLPAGKTHTYEYTVKAGYYLLIGYAGDVKSTLEKGTFTITGKAV